MNPLQLVPHKIHVCWNVRFFNENHVEAFCVVQSSCIVAMQLYAVK